MIVVADTSPLNYLVLIGQIDLLPVLYGSVLIPPAVHAELSHTSTPTLVRQWIAAPPKWLLLRSPAQSLQIALDAGESQALALATEVHADVILIDDLFARQAAERLGFNVTGVLGVLALAAQRKKIVFEDAVTSLRGTNFHVSQALIDRVHKSFE